MLSHTPYLSTVWRASDVQFTFQAKSVLLACYTQRCGARCRVIVCLVAKKACCACGMAPCPIPPSHLQRPALVKRASAWASLSVFDVGVVRRSSLKWREPAARVWHEDASCACVTGDMWPANPQPTALGQHTTEN